jgi:hypothetical protein
LSDSFDYQFQPNNGYYYSIAGNHRGWLRGPANADVGLALLMWNGSAWVLVETIFTFGGTEPIDLSRYGAPGYYEWVIYSVDGSGAYEFWLEKPSDSTTPTGSFSLSATPSTVAPGGQVRVTWSVPSGRPQNDWVGIFPRGGTNALTYQYTGGKSLGSATFTAPSQPGVYEFGYIVLNGSNWQFAAHSATVEVKTTTPGTSQVCGHVIFQNNGTIFGGADSRGPLVVRPNVQAQVVHLEVPAGTYLNLDAVMVFDNSGTNVALNKPARQSSNSPWTQSNGAQGAVDGHTPDGGYHIHTNADQNPSSWEVDLQRSYTITEIRVYNRLDEAGRAANLKICVR